MSHVVGQRVEKLARSFGGTTRVKTQSAVEHFHFPTCTVSPLPLSLPKLIQATAHALY